MVLDIRCVVSVMVKYYMLNGDMEARAINNGLCEEFAWRVIDYMDGESQDLYMLSTPDFDGVHDAWPGHYWVFCKGRHYDAECPEGVDDWENLPIFQRFRQEFGGHDVSCFRLRFNG